MLAVWTLVAVYIDSARLGTPASPWTSAAWVFTSWPEVFFIRATYAASPVSSEHPMRVPPAPVSLRPQGLGPSSWGV